MTEIKGISVDEWKKKICEETERLRPQLIQLSHSIHDEPEIGFQEFKSAAKICDFLEKQGFERCGIIYVPDGTPRIAFEWMK